MGRHEPSAAETSENEAKPPRWAGGRSKRGGRASSPAEREKEEWISSQLNPFRLSPLGFPTKEDSFPPAPPSLPMNSVTLHIRELLGPVATRP